MRVNSTVFSIQVWFLEQAGLVRGQNESFGTSRSDWSRPALVANSLTRGQEKRTIRESEVQIGNSGLLSIQSSSIQTGGERCVESPA
jgi:hypothetical protein